MKRSTKFFDAICFGIGSFLTVFFLFIFTLEGLIGLGCYSAIYYPLLQKLGIGVGVALICIGLLRKYWRKHTSPYKEPEEMKDD